MKEEYFIGLTKDQLQEKIKKIEAEIGNISGRTERMKYNPEDVYLEEKQEALKEVLNKYGKDLDCANMSIEQIAMGVARIQGEEKILRNDIARLSVKENTNELKKVLEIARRVLADKKQHGGRN